MSMRFLRGLPKMTHPATPSRKILHVSEYERAIFAAAAFAQKATDCLHGMQSPPSDG
jgi:antirestriction protein ArdC